MYPRNAASPEPIAIGAVVQISDGAVQTSGCTVRIKPIGVAEADGGGTTAYSTDGVILYTPTQAETNYTSFLLIAKKASCIPVAITVVTTASVTPGKVVLSGETHNNAVIPTVTTTVTATNLTNLPSIPANWLTAAGIADAAFTAAKLAANALTAAKFAADAITAIQSGLATAAQINSLAINTRANLQVPVEIETPDAGTQVYKIRLHLFDVEGNMEAPDSTPTIVLTNAAGTDRSERLSAASNPSAGLYTWDYTATAGDAEEQLVWVFTVVEGTLTRTYPATSYVVEETAYRFSSSDRANLNAATSSAATAATQSTTAATQSTAAATSAASADTKLSVSRLGKLDSLTFTVANQVDANALTGGGGTGSESTLMQSTTIATVTSQTVLILAAGSADDDAYNNQLVVITDSVTSTQKARCLVSDYVGLTKTLTLAAAPAFIVAAGDTIKIIAIGGDAQQATVTSISGQMSGARLSVAGPVTPGGDISLVVGSDYVEDIDSSLTRAISDAGQALYDKLTAGELSELRFSGSPAAGSADAEKVAGTITAVSHSAGITSVVIAIARAAIPSGPYNDEWTYQIWRVTDDHVSPPHLQGSLELIWRA